MRKLSLCVLSAAAVLTIAGTTPMVSQAAVMGVRISTGGRQMAVIGDIQSLFEQIGGRNCGTFPVPGMPDGFTPEFPGDFDEEFGQTGSEDTYAAQVVKLVNEERAKAGLNPLTVHSLAETAARVRADELKTSFSHTRPNGQSFETALKAAGISYMAAGENIAYGQRTPEEVMKSWMNSQGHRANILNPQFTSIGVGHVNSGGVDYWTQLFVTER